MESTHYGDITNSTDEIPIEESPKATLLASNGISRPPEREDPKNYIEAPFSYQYSEEESVILNAGALQLTKTDLILPGKNGFDLVIKRRYDSSTSNM